MRRHAKNGVFFGGQPDGTKRAPFFSFPSKKRVAAVTTRGLVACRSFIPFLRRPLRCCGTPCLRLLRRGSAIVLAAMLVCRRRFRRRNLGGRGQRNSCCCCGLGDGLLLLLVHKFQRSCRNRRRLRPDKAAIVYAVHPHRLQHTLNTINTLQNSIPHAPAHRH